MVDERRYFLDLEHVKEIWKGLGIRRAEEDPPAVAVFTRGVGPDEGIVLVNGSLANLALLGLRRQHHDHRVVSGGGRGRRHQFSGGEKTVCYNP